MLKNVLKLSFLTLMLSPLFAQAAQECYLDGTVSGIGLSIGWGGQIISGDGSLVCDGAQAIPVELQFVSGGWGFDFSIIKKMKVTSSVFLLERPEDVEGKYSIGATAGATLIREGVDFNVALQAQKNNLGFELALTGKEAVGLGARLQAMVFIVKPKN